MKKASLRILAALTAIFMLYGCSAAVDNELRTDPPPAVTEGTSAIDTAETGSGKTLTAAASDVLSITDVTPQPLIPHGYTQNTAAQNAANGANDFAFRLGAALVGDSDGENFVCSPFSVWLPLAALLNATDGANKESLLEALGAAGIGAEDINTAASRMLYDLTNEAEREWGEEYYSNPLKIANAVFVGDNVTLNKDFAQVFADYYRGAAFNTDFKSADAVDAVNQWASDNTDGLITNIISEFDPDTVAAVANAIYFSDRWVSEFAPHDTAEGVFYSPNGETTARYMLKIDEFLVYFEDDNVQAVTLRFASGGGMNIILPKDGDAVGLLSGMTNRRYKEIIGGSEIASGKLLLPRFSIESDAMQLKDTLTALGVPLFNEETAPLTGRLIEEDIPVWLSSAVQKAVIEADEKGTTAAAVTVMAATGGGAFEPTEPFEMICDKPFVFVLYGDTYDGGSQVLFTGAVNDPGM